MNGEGVIERSMRGRGQGSSNSTAFGWSSVLNPHSLIFPYTNIYWFTTGKGVFSS
jgi:hypothetical protein